MRDQIAWTGTAFLIAAFFAFFGGAVLLITRRARNDVLIRSSKGCVDEYSVGGDTVKGREVLNHVLTLKTGTNEMVIRSRGRIYRKEFEVTGEDFETFDIGCDTVSVDHGMMGSITNPLPRKNR